MTASRQLQERNDLSRTHLLARQITMVYYLNPDWDASMGGQLRIHVGSDGSERGKWDVEPFLDRLVMFRSDLVDHEVSGVIYLIFLAQGLYAAYYLRQGCPWLFCVKDWV